MYPTRRSALRLTLPLVLVLVALSTLLIALRIEQVLLEFAQERGLRAANQLSDQVEAAMRSGTPLPQQSQLPQWLERQREQDDSLVGARVLDARATTVLQLGHMAAFDHLNPVWTGQLLAQGVYAHSTLEWIVRSDGTTGHVGVPLFAPSGARTGAIWLAFDRSGTRESIWPVMRELLPWSTGIAAALALALAALAAMWMRTSHVRLGIAQRALATDTEEARARRPLDVVNLVEEGHSAYVRLWHELLLLVVAFALTFGALAALAWKAGDIARPLLLEQIDRATQTALRLGEGQIDRALSLGVPASALESVEAMFRAELAPSPEIAFLALLRPGAGVVAYGQRNVADKHLEATARQALAAPPGEVQGRFRITREPVEWQGRALGELVAGTPVDYVDGKLRSILLDLLFAVIVSLVLVREALGLLWERSQLRPYLSFEGAWQGWRRRAAGAKLPQQWLDWLTEARNGVRRWAGDIAARASNLRLVGTGRELVRIRLLVFLTALSDEMLRPFFSVFASEVQPMATALSPTMQAALPVTTFMLTLTLAQPLGPWITQRVDVRRALFVVAVCGAALVGVTALAHDSVTLMLLRAGSGAAYGLMMILAQTLIIRITDVGQRARGLVEVPAAIVAGGVCGPALGGLIVERLGAGAAFAACAFCLAAAAVTCLRLAPLPPNARGNLASLGGWRGMAAVMRHGRLMAVTWFAAVPARLVAAALLAVETPLYMQELGEGSEVAGRVQLLYFLAFMLTAPSVARWSDLHRRRTPWIVWGCVLSAASCAALPLWGGVAGMAACCMLLGVAQAMMSAPQLALVTETFDRDPHATQVVGATPEQALAAFRFIERFGSIAAPFAVAVAVDRFGVTGAVGAIGVVLLAGAVGVMIALWNFETGERHATA